MFWLVAVIGAVALLFFSTLLGTVIGAFSGWVVGWFFAETILGFFSSIGIQGFEMWQLGAVLGFIGPFFRSYRMVSKS